LIEIDLPIRFAIKKFIDKYSHRRIFLEPNGNPVKALVVLEYFPFPEAWMPDAKINQEAKAVTRCFKVVQDSFSNISYRCHIIPLKNKPMKASVPRIYSF